MCRIMGLDLEAVGTDRQRLRQLVQNAKTEAKEIEAFHQQQMEAAAAAQGSPGAEDLPVGNPTLAPKAPKNKYGRELLQLLRRLVEQGASEDAPER